jgi:hypothetical protein
MKYASETVLFFPMEGPQTMKTYSEQRLIELAKTSPAFQQHTCDEWFRRYRTESQVYSEHQLRQLAEWLVRFANCPAPQIQKEVMNQVTYKSEQPEDPKRTSAKGAAKKAAGKKRKTLAALQADVAEKNAKAKKEGKSPTLEIYC